MEDILEDDLDECDDTDEIEESFDDSEFNQSNKTANDEDLNISSESEDVIVDKLAYLPCAAHNIQLVLKDGFEKVPEFDALIKKISRDIVNRSKFSILIAKELRKFDKKFSKRVVTRWNSVLFTARSVLKVTNHEYREIQKKMPKKSTRQQEARKKFELTVSDRAMLEELVNVLEWFEWVTDEFQSNRVSISRVYPCVEFLRLKLTENLDSLVYTRALHNEFLVSLNKRFGILIKNEVFVVSTFLDPNFGLDGFPPEKKNQVKQIIKDLLLAVISFTGPEFIRK